MRDSNGPRRDKVEEDPSSSETRYEFAFAQAPIGMVLLTPDGQFKEVNQAYVDALGYTREELLSRDSSWFTHPEDVERTKNFFVSLQTGPASSARVEKRYFRKDGQILWARASGRMRRDAEGRPVEVIAIVEDITERKRAEDRLWAAAQQIQEDRRRWRELLQQTPAGIALLGGPDHRFEWVNTFYEQLVGRSADALIGKTFSEAFPEVEDQSYVDLLNGVYRTGEAFIGHESPIRLNRANGMLEELFLNFVYLPTRDANGTIDGIFIHVTDVTDAVLARKQIEESERQFRTLAETIPHLAWIADPAGNRVWFNRRWYDYTGTTFEEVKNWGWKKVLDAGVLADVTQIWEQAAASGEPFEMIYPVRGSDGSFRSFLTRVEPVKDRTGRVVRWFGTNTDITEQRRTEDELRRLNRELEEFAYVASHDLQEPIRMINIYTQLIAKNLDGANERVKPYAQFVEEGARRMQALIDDLLLFSRSVHYDEAQPGGAADLSSALEQAISVLKGRIEEAGAVITAGTLPNTRGDTQQLTQVFQNILSNSVKYRRSNVPLQIQISAEKEFDKWVICVRDNGIGFAPQYAERIFGLFKRLHKEEYPGTGLGLAICKRIVERYGGRIWAEGRPGEGTSFYFALPSI
jgi:PAS domain S-box-containing protein